MIEPTDTSLPKKNRDPRWIHTIEGMQECASYSMQRFQRGEFTAQDLKAVASLIAVGLMLEKAKRERDGDDPQAEDYEIVKSLTRGSAGMAKSDPLSPPRWSA